MLESTTVLHRITTISRQQKQQQQPPSIRKQSTWAVTFLSPASVSLTPKSLDSIFWLQHRIFWVGSNNSDAKMERNDSSHLSRCRLNDFAYLCNFIHSISLVHEPVSQYKPNYLHTCEIEHWMVVCVFAINFHNKIPFSLSFSLSM